MQTERDFILRHKEDAALQNIKLIITDVDGCLTDANIYLPDGGEPVKGFSVQDGYATKHALDVGLQIAFLSGKNSSATTTRAAKLGIPEQLCAVGICENKIAQVHRMQEFAGASKEETLFFGDDVLDIEVKEAVGTFACPQNALFYVHHASDLHVPKRGGQGAFRLLLDLVLYAQQKHFAQSLIDAALR